MSLEINSSNDIQRALLELAHVRQDTEAGVANLDRDLNEITIMKNALIARRDALEQETREAILTYMANTGDLHAHPNVTFQRRKKLVYDKAEAFQWAKEHAHDLYIRVKEELDVRAFEGALKNGALDGQVDFEEVNAPTLEIGKLGDLLLTESSSE